jgi:hypothetical protein
MGLKNRVVRYCSFVFQLYRSVAWNNDEVSCFYSNPVSCRDRVPTNYTTQPPNKTPASGWTQWQNRFIERDVTSCKSLPWRLFSSRHQFRRLKKHAAEVTLQLTKVSIFWDVTPCSWKSTELPWEYIASETSVGLNWLHGVISQGRGKLASFFYIALGSKKEVSLPHPWDITFLITTADHCRHLSTHSATAVKFPYRERLRWTLSLHCIESIFSTAEECRDSVYSWSRGKQFFRLAGHMKVFYKLYGPYIFKVIKM